MFLGHYAAAFAAKKADSKLSLGTLILAGQFIDLLWPLFLIAGLERVAIDPGNTAFTPLNFVEYPYTHSLLGVLAWSGIVGIFYYLLRRRVRGAVLLSALVASHWILDFLTHRPDLPIVPGASLLVGLGLWNFPVWSVIVEGALFAGGVALYATSTRPRTLKGRYGFWSLILFLVVIYAASIFSPPPPSDSAIAWSALLLWLLVPWAYWIDRHRTERHTSEDATTS